MSEANDQQFEASVRRLQAIRQEREALWKEEQQINAVTFPVGTGVLFQSPYMKTPGKGVVVRLGYGDRLQIKNLKTGRVSNCTWSNVVALDEAGSEVGK